MMRGTTLERAGIRSMALDSAKYSTAFSVAYAVIGENPVSHDLARPPETQQRCQDENAKRCSNP